MKTILTLALLIFTINALAQKATYGRGDCPYWIDVKDGTRPKVGPPGYQGPTFSGTEFFSGGHNYAQLKDGTWIDVKDGTQPAVGPPGYQGPTFSGTEFFSGGHNYALVPCPPPTDSSTTGGVKPVAAHSTATDLFSVGLGYTFMRTAQEEVKNLNGFQVSGFYNVNPWFAVGGQVSGLYGSHTEHFGGGSVDTSLDRYRYLFGPQVTFPFLTDRVAIQGHLLVGGVYDRNEISFSGGSSHSSANAFAMAVGGGVQVRVTRNLSIGPEFDYAPTAFSSAASSWQNNWTASVVFNFRF